MRKKVVYLIRTLRIGGAERQIVEVATRLNRQLFEPKIYGISGGGPLSDDAERQGVSVTSYCFSQHGLFKGHLAYMRKFFALVRYLGRERPDILHTYMYTPSVYGRLARTITGNPVVITSQRRLDDFKDGKPHYRLLEKFLNRFADQILCNSEAVKQSVLRRQTIPANKIRVIYNGVDLKRFQPLQEASGLSPEFVALKQSLGIPMTAKVIGMIANLHPYKGYQEFLKAAFIIYQQQPETHFLCIGEDRGMLAELEHIRQTSGLQACVTFTGQIQNIPEMLHIIDIQVSASHEEGFSNVILEGMACGKPVVATNVGGAPEAVVHDVTGLLVPPKQPEVLAQAIMTLLKHPELARSMGAHGRKRVEAHFSMEKMVQELERLYVSITRMK